MLARLETEPGVDTAEVDRRGELLHIRVSSAADVGRVIDRLQEMGFAGEPVAGAEAAARRWYGLDSVGELSQEEARVIAQRAVPVFAQQSDIEVGDIHSLSTLVATALHGCFITHDLDANRPPGALNSACGRAVEEATRSRLGPDGAAALGKAVEADLATRSAFKE